MDARLDIGEVPLTASISEVMLEVMLGVVARDVALADHIGEGHARQFGGFAEWENFLGYRATASSASRRFSTSGIGSRMLLATDSGIER